MDKIQELEQQVKILSLSIRVCITIIIVVFAFQSILFLSCSEGLRHVYDDVFGGAQLAVMAEFFLSNAPFVMIGVLLQAIVGILVVLVWPKSIWSMPVGVASACSIFVTAQLALFSLMMPLLSIMIDIV